LRYTLKLSHIITFIIAFQLIVLIIIMSLHSQTKQAQATLDTMHQERIDALYHAKLLEESSELLTHFARSYVATKDLKFKENFFRVLSIRNGESPRPENYSALYWNYQEPMRSQLFPLGEKSSLESLINSYDLTIEESSLLQAAHSHSDTLAELEQEAFAALEGLFLDNNNTYTIRKDVDQNYALSLLYSQQYYAAKHEIMERIDSFNQHFKERLQKELFEQEEKIARYMDIIHLILLSLFVGNIAIFFFFRRELSLAVEKFSQAIISSKKDSPQSIASLQTSIYEFNMLMQTFYDAQLEIAEKTQQLHLVRKRFENMFHNHDAIMLLVEPQSGAIVDANKSAVSFYGYTKEALLSMNIADLNLLTQEEIRKYRNQAINKKKNSFIFRHRLHSGEWRIVDVHSSPIQTEKQTLLFSIIKDITEDKENEKKLQRTLNLLSQAKQVAKLGVWEYDLKEKKLHWSDEVFELFELNKESFEPSHETFLNTIHPQDRQRVDATYKNSLQTKQSYSITYRFITKNKTLKYVQEQCDTEFDSTGEPLRSVGTVYDISAFVELNQKLELQKDRYKNLMELSSDAILIMNIEDGSLIEYSQMAQKILGYSDEEMRTLSVYDWDLEMDTALYAQMMQEIGYTPVTIERRHKRKDKTYYTASITAVKVMLDEKEYIYAAVRDITQQQEEQELVKLAEKKFHTIFEESLDGLALLDLDTQVFIEWNQRVLEMYGYSAKEFAKLQPEDLDAQSDLEGIKQSEENILQKGWDKLTAKHKTKSGKLLDVLVSARAFELENRKVLFVTFHDITDQVKQEEEIRKAQKEADKANKAKSEFLANMSHEIRTPLNGIIGLTGIVRQTELTSMQRDYLDKAINASHALLHIINDILDYSKIEAGKLEIASEEFSLSELLKSVANLFGFSIAQKDLECIFKIDENIPDHLYGDSLRIAQVLHNLIGNAIKFTSQGSIQAGLKLLERKVHSVSLEFSIKDTGIGISQEKQQKLFKAFEQGDSSTTKEYGGTGLGLMISKQLIELMNGEIFVQSKEGEGSCFSFVLELNVASEETFAQNPFRVSEYSLQEEQDLIPSESYHASKSQKILLVEDNEINQLVAQNMLEEYGFEVVIAHNGKEAVLHAKEESFCLIFMDLQMPVMDGYEATQKIKEFDPNTPIVALSAAVMQEDREKTRELKMVEHLAKPIDKQELENVIKKYCS